MQDSHLFTDPPENTDSKPFYDAAAQGRFLARKCRECGEPHWYPRPYCPFCGGETDWVELSGDGTVYSYSISRRADPPYAIAYVALAEGVSMLTNLVDCDFDALAIGQKVRLTFKPTVGGRRVPCFTPASD
jgi:uncharacterized OB-fold protein